MNKTEPDDIYPSDDEIELKQSDGDDDLNDRSPDPLGDTWYNSNAAKKLKSLPK